MYIDPIDPTNPIDSIDPVNPIDPRDPIIYAQNKPRPGVVLEKQLSLGFVFPKQPP